MKRKTREQLRGRPLDELCKKAHTAPYEYGPEDNRVFCHGLIDAMTDEPPDQCRICGAFVRNETPPEGIDCNE